MKITKETESYNTRRYGKPWIAKVDFSDDPKGKFEFGDWIGDARNGGSGTLVIEAEQGDIVATGQKDFRKERNSAPDFYELNEDSKLSYLGDKGQAYKHWMKKPMPERETLLEERKVVLKRLEEIDALILAWK